MTGEVFDADFAAARLLGSDMVVRQSVRERFGDRVFLPDGGLDRTRLREIVFDNDLRRRELENILHPVIRKEWLEMVERHRASAENTWLIIDIPLLFETRAESHFDCILVVACSLQRQRERLMKNRNLSSLMTEKMIGSQMALNLKIQHADRVVWNDSAPAHLEEQASMVATALNLYHG